MKSIGLLLVLCAASVSVTGIQQPAEKTLTSNQSSAAESQGICVVGNVLTPSLVRVEGAITLTEAIQKAGGALPDSKRIGVKVYRSLSGVDKEMITIKELRAIERGRVKDIELHPGDVVEVVPREKKNTVPQASINPCPSKSPVLIL
jgi:hypothetical protein